jgi:SAM-dependent methyltransferase
MDHCLDAGIIDPRRSTLEAATGGGRIVRALQERGFTELAAFDLAPESVGAAQAGDATGRVRFAVADATCLPYPDASFAQAVYLQQLLSIIETAAGRAAATREAYRVVAPGGIVLVSVLCFDDRGRSRLRAAAVRAYTRYLVRLRRLRRKDLPPRLQPWAGVNGPVGMLLDWGPYAYWFRADEIEELLQGAGFAVEEVRVAEVTAPIRSFICRKGAAPVARG